MFQLARWLYFKMYLSASTNTYNTPPQGNQRQAAQDNGWLFQIPIIGLPSDFSSRLSPLVLFCWATPLPSLIPHPSPGTLSSSYFPFPKSIFHLSFGLFSVLLLCRIWAVNGSLRPFCPPCFSVTSGKFIQLLPEASSAQPWDFWLHYNTNARREMQVQIPTHSYAWVLQLPGDYNLFLELFFTAHYPTWDLLTCLLWSKPPSDVWYWHA